MATLPRNTPIIVGIGEVKNKSTRVEDAREPLDLILEAVRNSIQDAGVQECNLTPLVDSIAVVPPWTWAYEDLPGLIDSNLGIHATHLICGSHGGNQPALLCDQVARLAAESKSRVSIIAGGEALASLAACKKAGQMPPHGWTKPDPNQREIDTNDLDIHGKSSFKSDRTEVNWESMASLTYFSDIASVHEMGLAVQVYPFYENALKSHRQQSYTQNTEESAIMYADFDKTACGHASSWRSGETPRNPDDIKTVTGRNRMICTPYPLLMNAFNSVNLAAAAIVTTVEQAEYLKIPQDKWVYILGGAGAQETENFWERSCYYRSPALEQSIDGAISLSGLEKHDIDCYDFYSCFPIVPKLACRHLGLDITSPSKPISLLGGLTSFGGAGNNYSMHAIVEMTRKIRKRTHQTGLILANGGLLTYQHVLCLSSMPRKDGLQYPLSDTHQPTLAKGLTQPPFDGTAEGEATIETFTVQFNRQGTPEKGLIIGHLTRTGHRFLANHGDQMTLSRLCDRNLDPVGMLGYVTIRPDGRNEFFARLEGKL